MTTQKKVKLPWQGLIQGIFYIAWGICITFFIAYLFPEIMIFSWIAGVPSFLIGRGYLKGKRWAPKLSIVLAVLAFLLNINGLIYNPTMSFSFIDAGLPILLIIFTIYCAFCCLKSPAYLNS